MSAFSSLLKSLDGNDDQPARPIDLPPLKSNPQSGVSAVKPKSAPTTPSAPPGFKPVYKGTAGLSTTSQQSVGLKRKAEDISTERPVKLHKSDVESPNHSNRFGQRLNKHTGPEIKSQTVSKLPNGNSLQNAAASAKGSTKAPSKGSYAEMMARAKEAAQTKPPSQIGLIKHQATEKVKPSKLADRRKAEQEKSKHIGGTSITKNGQNGKSDPRRRSVSPMKVTKRADGPKQTKVPLPPLHAPARAQVPAYRGTLGQSTKKRREPLQSKKPRYDEYLGTDEDDGDNDEGGYGRYEDGEDYYSDDLSDMEGGFDDIDAEERQGLRAAKEDDAKELALELKLKKEKLERKQKLAALAAKRR